MNCPNCGGKTYVIDARTSERFEKSYRRRRICYKCKIRFTTYEVLIESLSNLSNSGYEKDLLKKINNLINKYMEGEMEE